MYSTEMNSSTVLTFATPSCAFQLFQQPQQCHDMSAGSPQMANYCVGLLTDTALATKLCSLSSFWLLCAFDMSESYPLSVSLKCFSACCLCEIVGWVLCSSTLLHCEMLVQRLAPEATSSVCARAVDVPVLGRLGKLLPPNIH